MSAEGQRRYDEAYFDRMERERPKAPLDLDQIKLLAREAAGDPARALDLAVACAPEKLMLAFQAAAWDERHPYYVCVSCRDGKDLPRGYVCKDCGEDNGYQGRA